MIDTKAWEAWLGLMAADSVHSFSSGPRRCLSSLASPLIDSSQISYDIPIEPGKYHCNYIETIILHGGDMGSR